MICIICRQADIIDGQTSVKFERGEMRLIMNSVPAWICPSCGEAYVDEGVAVQLLQETEKVSKAGMLNVVYEYSPASEKGNVLGDV